MNRHYTLRFVPFGLFALLLVGALLPTHSLPANAAATSNEVINVGETGTLIVNGTDEHFRLSTEFTSPFTVRSVIKIGPNYAQQVEHIDVLGLTAAAGDGDAAIRLLWEQDTAGWWPTWQLVLVAGHNVTLNDTKGGRVSLGQIVPAPGQIYEATLSYNEAGGVLSLSMADVTDAAEGKSLVNASFQAGGLPSSLLVYTGARGTKEPPTQTSAVEIMHLDGQERFVPVGAQWARMVESTDGSTIAAKRVHSDEHLLITVDAPPVPIDSHFRLIIAADDEVILEQAIEPQQALRIPGVSLPLGEATVRLAYVDDHGVLVLDEWSVQVGHLDVLVHRVTPDPASRIVQGVAQLTSPTAIDGIPFRLTATVNERVWNAADRVYEDRPYAEHVLHDGALTVPAGVPLNVPFTVPYPDVDGTWRLTTQAETPVSHTVHRGGGLHLFETNTGENKSSDVSLRVCTYNVYGFDAFPQEAARRVLGGPVTPQRIDHFIGVMRELDCDITALQEANSVAWVQILANGLDINAAVSSTRTRFPGGVLTPYSILATRDYATGGQANNVPYSRTAGAALLDIDGRHVWVVNLHAHPNEEQLRIQEARILGEKVDELLAISPYMIVLGDFNSVPGQVIHKALTDRGFVNTMELAANMYTPTMNRQEGGMGTRAIDHIYVSEPLTGTVRRSWVVMDPGFRMPDRPDPDHWLHSDHLPVAAELQW